MLYCNQLGETEEKDVEKQDRREALDVAALAGDILLASGAEIFRVEETIFRIARAYGVESSDAFVLSSGIFLTAGSEREQDFARVRHIPLSAARLDRVTAVNQLSREIVEGKHTPAQARERLIQIQKMPPKPKSHQVLASGVGSACFCFLFGGDPVDSLAAFAAGIVFVSVSSISGAWAAFQNRGKYLRRRAGDTVWYFVVSVWDRTPSGRNDHRFDHSAGAWCGVYHCNPGYCG